MKRVWSRWCIVWIVRTVVVLCITTLPLPPPPSSPAIAVANIMATPKARISTQTRVLRWVRLILINIKPHCNLWSSSNISLAWASHLWALAVTGSYPRYHRHNARSMGLWSLAILLLLASSKFMFFTFAPLAHCSSILMCWKWNNVVPSLTWMAQQQF